MSALFVANEYQALQGAVVCHVSNMSKLLCYLVTISILLHHPFQCCCPQTALEPAGHFSAKGCCVFGVTKVMGVQISVVANLANTNALILKENGPKIPAENMSCLTLLDHKQREPSRPNNRESR